jgi:hypothetical protein
MSVTRVLPNEDEFEGVEILSQTGTTKTPDINESEAGAIEPRQQTDTPEMLPDNAPLNQLVSWQQFLSLLLKTGGWTVAVLLAFRFVVVPLLTAGNTPVALTLAIAVSIFLVLCAISGLVREFRR